VPGGEQVDSRDLIAEMAAAVAERFDLDGIAAMATAAADSRADMGPTSVCVAAAAIHAGPASAGPRRSSPAPVIAVARDEAFCFYYPENLELLVEAGAAVEFFSPLRGERPPAQAAGIYLGGGYPELHGSALASNIGLWSAIRDLHAANLPIYAECGGFMVLTEALLDAQGRRWPMAALLPGVARMSGNLAALGYRYATALNSNLLVEQGDTLRGHEFRYSSWVCEPSITHDTAAWQVRGARADTPTDLIGYVSGNLLASYLHVHFGQHTELARHFVERLS
jgi:cobyrinic acid a,c-diamide synthase